jgi:tetratricopeptide (TPR) repeat protein
MATANQPLTPPAQKLCIACKESIPADAAVCFHCRSSQLPEKEPGSKRILKWIGLVTAVIGLITGLSGVVGPLKGWWTQGRQSKSMLAMALHQEEAGEYPAALDTLNQILKADPANHAALHARLDVAMLWLENIWAPFNSNDAVAQQTRPIFASLTPVLEAGLGAADYRTADVVAHLGWLNLLKWKIAGEDGIVEEHLLRALQMDPANVYANAMMGDFILQTGGSLDEAKAHFATALKTGKVKPFVRICQLEGMIYNDHPGVRAELIRLANQMRKDGDFLGDANRGRIRSCFSSIVTTDVELREAVTAVPPDEVWETYQWLSPPDPDPSSFKAMEARFVQANIDETSGQRAQALEIYRELVSKVGDPNASLARRSRAGVKRLGP